MQCSRQACKLYRRGVYITCSNAMNPLPCNKSLHILHRIVYTVSYPFFFLCLDMGEHLYGEVIRNVHTRLMQRNTKRTCSTPPQQASPYMYTSECRSQCLSYSIPQCQDILSPLQSSSHVFRVCGVDHGISPDPLTSRGSPTRRRQVTRLSHTGFPWPRCSGRPDGRQRWGPCHAHA